MLHQNGLKYGDETFGLLVSTYWASENVIVNHLGLNSLPWQPYCYGLFAAHLGKITKNRQFQHDVNPLIHNIASDLELAPKIKPHVPNLGHICQEMTNQRD